MKEGQKNNLTQIDHKIIFELIEENSKVLDLGCGEGELLEALVKFKNCKGQGVELIEKNVLKCIARGLNVFQGDIDEGLEDYEDKSFDYVILNLTIQMIHKPLFVVQEMLRVGKKGIVCFPNFANIYNRFTLFFRGRAPRGHGLNFEWYDTPDIRMITVKDFYKMCEDNNIRILKSIGIIGSLTNGKVFNIMKNLLCTYALFLLSKE